MRADSFSSRPQTELRNVPLESLKDIRIATLSPGHPGRPVFWSYDRLESSEHFGFFEKDQRPGKERLVGCVSIHKWPHEDNDPATTYQFHSMGIVQDRQRDGLGSEMLNALFQKLQERGATMLWATARESALKFYENHGFDVAKQPHIVSQTGFKVWDVSIDVSRQLEQQRPTRIDSGFGLA